ncbi:putative membrane transporter protein YfcA [BD1-7 clade bacterium]|uniref:Probable membrane transporter protein n=1 Tax=BD1-7 clade bacterium TaxID=2029982 RepID=A0A5S9NYB5_9GAMM|nr:putative membrane transporter protein YfcA [BD1-7 clade bacterium]CAA0095794.1 putative membrane transporter protein YfcA [BD1-7 clade bacterium]
MDIFHALALLVGSIFANALAAFAGGGAGLVQMPLLLLLGLPFSIALGTHKIATVALGLGATSRHLKSGELKLNELLYVIACGTLGVILGARVIVNVPDDIAKTLLGILIVGLGIYSIQAPGLGIHHTPQNRTARGYTIGAVGLCFIGFLNGSLTAGTGLFVTIFLIKWFGFDYKKAVTNAMISVGLFWNSIGAVTVWQAGAPIKWEWLGLLLIGSFVGGYVGAHFMSLKNNRVIKRAYEALCLLIGITLTFGLF